MLTQNSNMDRQISATEIKKAARRKLVKWLIVLALIVLAVASIQAMLSPSIDPDDIRIATVKRGDIHATINATGRVIPKQESVITSEIASRVEQIHLQPGTLLQPGDLILTLNSEQLDVRITQTEQQILLKQNQLAAMQLAHQSALRKNQNRQALLEIELEKFRVRLERYKHLYKSKIVSEFEVQDAELSFKRANTELAQQNIENEAAIEGYLNQVKTLELEQQILQTQLQELAKQKRNTEIRATSQGVLTSVIEQVGTAVGVGQELCKISDLTAFKVEASASDFYAGRLSQGQKVKVEIGSKLLTGQVERLLPSSSEGRLSMWIELDQANHPDLRANLRAEAHIITDSMANVLTLENGDYLNGAGIQQVFVVADGQAQKAQIEVGLKNQTQVEIKSGLNEGDRVIISKLDDKQHLNNIAIN